MGWQIDIKETKEGTRYRVWSTNVDKWLTEWSTRDEILEFVFWARFNDFMYDFSELCHSFPNRWCSKEDFKLIFSEDKLPSFYDLNEKTGTDKLFKQNIERLGIKITAEDSEGNKL